MTATEQFRRIPVLVFDTCVFGAALYKGVQHLQDGFLQASRLLQVLLRDSLVYFMVSVYALTIHFGAHGHHVTALTLWS